MAAQVSSSQPLPTKESNLFKQVVKFYEQKQYKKSLKAADQASDVLQRLERPAFGEMVLKKFPDHGESLAMKGLTLNSLDKKDEAYELVRRGVKADLKSHVVWHVYGLLNRSHREYREAIKCYMNALRIDKENVQILRDLALLQVQMRDLTGFVDTRQQLLQLKPNQRQHWITFAMAHHINGAFDVSSRVLDAYESTLEEVSPVEAYEYSEMLLYKAQILDEGGQMEEALQLLERSKDKVRDKMGMQEAQASLLQRTGRLAEAEAAYRRLLRLNPDNYKMHEGLQASMSLVAAPGESLSAEQRQRLAALYSELSAAFPLSTACRRIPLDFTEGDAFRAVADVYVRRYLRKGIPSLFMDMKPLYRDPAKVTILQELFQAYASSLQDSGAFPPLATASGSDSATTETAVASSSSSSSSAADADAAAAARGSSGEAPVASSSGQAAVAAEGGRESPMTRVWVLFYLAQHYDRLGQVSLALQLLEEALHHTPTLVELYTFMAKVLQHAGDPQGGVLFAEIARVQDLSDRYLNSRSAKAMFKANQGEAAERTAAMFTKDGDQVSNLYDMQHMWYECAAGSSFLRRKDYGMALKQYLAVVKQFADIREDQFDFHTYCVRKMTLRSYIAMLRMEDALYSHHFFSKAAGGAIKCYLALHDKPASRSGEEDEEAAMAGLSAEERKKLKLKRKKDAKRKQEAEEKEAQERERAVKERQEKEEKERAAAGKAGDTKKKGVTPAAKEKDPDPHGAALAAVADPLAEATKLVVMLKENAASRLQTHLLSFEVYIRKGRLLLVAAAVQRALALAGPSDPDVHRCLVRFCLSAQSASIENATVKAVLEEAVAAMLGTKTLRQYVDEWCQTHASTDTASLVARCAAADALLTLDANDRARAAQIVTSAPLKERRVPFSHADCVAAHQLLQSPAMAAGGEATAAAAQWFQQCSALWPRSVYFEGADRHRTTALAATAAEGALSATAAVANGVAQLTL